MGKRITATTQRAKSVIAFIKFNATHWKWDPLCGSGIECRKMALEVSRHGDWNL